MSQITDQTILDNSKDLPVPDFNKKEIEEISGQVFDKKIQSVPSGTKLYRHIYSYGPFGTIDVISNSPTSIDRDNYVSMGSQNTYSSDGETYYACIIALRSQYSSYYTLYGFTSEGVYLSQTVNLATAGSHTVTEL